ncbi:MAG: FAD-dependent oxidoreductase, partial [Erysipelotrichaceae bacterium]|nr:FAD-dependent oxidoreductase [Erysipelotrichaceae bacterium]
DLCKQLQVDYEANGAFVVATSKAEEENLDVLIRQCEERNIPFEVLTGDQARKEEPNLSPDVTKALSLPTTGIIMPFEVAIAAMEEAMMNGVELKLDYEVRTIDRDEEGFVINGEIKTKMIVNCAGAHCDEITEMLEPSPYKVETRKGEYFVLDHMDVPFVKHTIYPVPSEKGKGVLAMPTIHGNVLLGPDSEYCQDVEDDSTGKGLDYVRKEVAKTVVNIPFNKMIHTFAGLRPHIDLNDFYIKEDDNIENFIHIAGIESPGLTSAPAIAKDVAENIILPKYKDRAVKAEYRRRRPFIDMRHMSDEEKAELIKKDPAFGQIICRCEKISEGQIVDVINRECGARTVKGVKMRCRPGMGRCQGGFCEVEVARILAEQLKEDVRDVRLDRKGSNIVLANAKEDL